MTQVRPSVASAVTMATRPPSPASALALVCLCTVAAHAEPTPPSPAEVDVVYTGNTGGVGNPSFSAPTVSTLARAVRARGGSAVVDEVGPGALATGREIVFDPTELRRRPGVVVAQARSGARVVAARLSALEGEHDITFQYPVDPVLDLLAVIEHANRTSRADPTLHRVEVRLVEYRTASGARVLQVERGPEPGAADPGAATWEGLWAARGSVQLGPARASFYSVLKALGSGPRRVRLVDELRGGLSPGGTALLVSAGNEVSTVDAARPDRASRVRALDFATLARAGYAAIVPGDRELYFGLRALRDQLARTPLPMVATNLRARTKLGAPGAAPFARYLVVRVGSVTVAVLGLVRPDLAERVRGPDVVADLVVVDAAVATRAALADLRVALGGDADLVVVLDGLRGPASAAYLAQAQGVDVVIGDAGETGLHAPEQVVTTGSLGSDLGDERRPVIQGRASPVRVGHLHVELGRDGERLVVQRLADRQLGVAAELPRDEALDHALTALADRELDAGEVALVPSFQALQAAGTAEPGGGNEAVGQELTPRRWHRLVVNLLRASSDAEVAVLPPPPDSSQDVVDLTLFRWALTDDRIVACELTGAQLKGLALALGDTALFSGLDVEHLLVGGRPLNNTERYRVILAGSVLAFASADRVLRGVELRGQFRLAGGRLVTDGGGRTVRLGELVVAALRERRGHSAGFEPRYLDQLRTWLLPQGSEPEPRWSLGVDNLTLALSGYANRPGNAWVYNQGGREARTSTADNYSAMFKATGFVTYDSPAYTWDNRVIAELAYSELKLGASPGLQDVVAKTADDVWIATELQLNRWRMDLRRRDELRLVSYVTAAYDTEVTRTTDLLTGVVYPRRKDLFASIGLVTHPRGILKLLRVGALGRADLASDTAHFDGGLLVATRLEIPLATSLLKLGGRLRYFAPARGDTAKQLGFVVESSAQLVFPVTRDLAFSLGVDVFVYRAKRAGAVDMVTGAPFDRGTSLSVLSTAGVTFDHLWKR